MQKISGSVDSFLLTPGLDTINCRLTGQGSCDFSVSLHALVTVNGETVSPAMLLPWFLKVKHPIRVTMYPDESKDGVSFHTDFHGDHLKE